MIEMPYDPNDVTTDGPYTCPRVWHHVFNALLGLAIYAIVAAIAAALGIHSVALLAATGPVILLVSRVKEWVRPTDPRRYSLALHLEDAATDGACYSSSLPLALLSISTMAAIASALALFATYRAFRHGARP